MGIEILRIAVVIIHAEIVQHEGRGHGVLRHGPIGGCRVADVIRAAAADGLGHELGIGSRDIAAIGIVR